MSRFNHHLQNHFGSCLLLAHARDPYRERDVQLRMLPGEFDIVGVTDGTDAWVAPTAGDPFGVGIKRILEDIRAGRMPTPQPLRKRERRALAASTPDPAPAPAPALLARRERRRIEARP